MGKTSGRLRSWMIRVKKAQHKLTTNEWGEPISYRQIQSYYVVARTRKDAVSQAKRLAGYITTKERLSGAGVHLVEILSDLEQAR